jgi:negative regulator of sigma E activity
MTTGAGYDDCLFAAKHHCSAIAWMATLDQSVQQQNILLAALSAHPSAIEYIRVQHIRTEEQSRKLAQHFVRSCFNKGMSQDEVIKTAEQSQCPHLFLDVMSVLSSVKPTH